MSKLDDFEEDFGANVKINSTRHKWVKRLPMRNFKLKPRWHSQLRSWKRHTGHQMLQSKAIPT